MTVAGSEDRKSGLTLVGVAAHITAASPGGPRYDPLMKHDERASESNGIWTCQTHAKFVDDNPSVCTIDELQRWKQLHEKWVFERVASGAELLVTGITRLRFRNVGMFHDEQELRLGRHNILVGPNEAGKTTVAEIAAAFSGGSHWSWFNLRFEFCGVAADSRSYISATAATPNTAHRVTLSPYSMPPTKGTRKTSTSRLHIEINGNVSADWPRTLFRTVHLDDQLVLHQGDPKTPFDKALRYLAGVFAIDENVLLDSLREETYANSTLGFRFRRAEKRKIKVLVPDGRAFFLPTGLLSSSELCLALIDIVLKLILSSAPHDQWLLILDTGFFGRLDHKAKSALFATLTDFSGRELQTLFCLSDTEDAETLRQAKLDSWVGASRLGDLTLHSFV